jgi:hypothetical protein
VVNVSWRPVVFVTNCQKIKIKQIWKITNTILDAIKLFLIVHLQWASDERQILGAEAEAVPRRTEYHAPE